MKNLFFLLVVISILAPTWVSPSMPEHATLDYGFGGSSVPRNDYFQGKISKVKKLFPIS